MEYPQLPGMPQGTLAPSPLSQRRSAGLPSAPPNLLAGSTNSIGLPAPEAITASPSVSLPTAPPKRAGLFDKEHRQDTLLAIATGMLSGFNFSDGMANVAQNLGQQRQMLRRERQGTREFGGPDNSFEITTDPATGKRTVNSVPEFQSYLEQKRTKAKDTADLNGRAMFALKQLPEADRPAAYAAMIANPAQYGIDASTMPAAYDDRYASVASGMGMTVAQATTRHRADESAEALEAYRKELLAARAAADERARLRDATHAAQGEARLAQGQQRLAISKAKGSGGGGKSGGRRAPKLNSSNNDLSYLLN